MKERDLKRIWSRMADPATEGKLKAKTNPQTLAKEIKNFWNVWEELSAREASSGKAIDPQEKAIAKQSLDTAMEQFTLRSNEMSHNLAVFERTSKNFEALLDSGLTANKAAEAIMHISPYGSANSLGGVKAGYASGLRRRLGDLYEKLSQEGRYFAAEEDVGFGASVGRALVEAMEGREPSSPDLKVFVDHLSRLADEAVEGFNQKGLGVTKMDNRGYWLRADSSHDRLRAMDMDTFLAKSKEMYDVLDWDKMQDILGTDLRTEGQRNIFFKQYYEDIVMGELTMSEGRLVREASSPFKGTTPSKAGRGRQHQRVIHFKNFEGWEKWSQEFGNGGNFGAHINKMVDETSTILAALDIMGTRPNQVLAAIEGIVSQRNGVQAANRVRQDVVNSYNFFMGRMLSPLSYTAKSWINGLRNSTGASMLGMHPVSALTTEMAGLMPSAHAMLGRPGVAAMMDTINVMNNTKNTEALSRAHIFTSEFVNLIENNWKQDFAVPFERYAKTAYYGVERGSGNGKISATAKKVASHSFEFSVVDFIRTNGDDLIADVIDDLLPENQTFYNLLRQQGLEKADLLKLSKYIKNVGDEGAPLHIFDFNDVKLSDPDYKIISRYFATLEAFKETASPTQSTAWQARTRALEGATGSQVIAGGTRLAMQFMSWPIQMYKMSMEPRLFRGTALQRMKATASFSSLMIAMGMMDVQLRNLLQGKTLEDPSFELLLKGFARSGAGHFIGESILSYMQNNRGGFLDRFVPVASPVLDTASMAGKHIGRVYNGKFEAANFGYDVSKILTDLMPGRRLWWVALPLERMMTDQIKKEIDPKAFRTLAKRREKDAKEKGQEFWWKPGQVTP